MSQCLKHEGMTQTSSSVFTGTPPDSLILESPFTNIREEAKSHPFSMVRNQVSHRIMDWLCATNKNITDPGHVYMFIWTGLQISTRFWLVLPGFYNCKRYSICQWWEVGGSCPWFICDCLLCVHIGKLLSVYTALWPYSCVKIIISALCSVAFHMPEASSFSQNLF